ncbi:hypothetical protein [Streptomyces sp. NPDC057939]|uniref:hypothetical protein n=1 Tax=Streptomyces sp. NPDC057939 TaxID=3346284 RepID=UPI0036E80EC5
MLDQALTALAAAAGTAVAAAAGTDVWSGLRGSLARWFGAGDTEREQDALDRLDRTAATLGSTPPAEVDQARIRQEASWQARIEDALEDLPAEERERAADLLRTLLAGAAPPAAGPGAVSVTGDVRADRGSIAAAVIHGGATVGTPHQPAPEEG